MMIKSRDDKRMSIVMGVYYLEWSVVSVKFKAFHISIIHNISGPNILKRLKLECLISVK